MQYTFSAVALLRAFSVVLLKRPLLALPIAYWWITRRKLRARLRLSAAIASLPDHYQIWLSLYQRGTEGAYTSMLPARDADPSIAIAVHLHIENGQVNTAMPAIESVLSQLAVQDALYLTSSARLSADALPTTYNGGPVHVVPEAIGTRAEALRRVLNMTEASHLVPLDTEARFTVGALKTYARAIAGDPSHCSIFYADQDERDNRGVRKNPWLKPGWDEDLFLAQDYLSRACILPTNQLRAVVDRVTGDDALVIYEIVARLVLTPEPIPVRHIPYVAVTTETGAWCRGNAFRADLVRRLLIEYGTVAAPPLVERGRFGELTVRRPLPEPPPKVSVIVPTRDRLDLLTVSVEGVLHRTNYPDIELVIADNGSVEPETLAFLERCGDDPRVKVVRWPHPYNYSAINNFAATHATGPYLCLLNNDTEVVDPFWLSEMVAYAVRPETGAVGARLIYPDRSVQHAGVVVGMGGAAGHAHRGLPDGDPGYFAQALVTRGATAVTAACLVVAKEKFEAVGGLDAEKLAIAYNDVDLCLKLRAAGWHNIYVAQAVLIHHEGKSRGLDFAPEHLARYLRELAAFQERWGAIGFRDPMHHPALDLASEIYRLKV